MIFDLVIIAILLISAGVAFMRGFVREVLTIGSLFGAALATFAFGPHLTPTVRGWIIDPEADEPQMLFNLVPYEMLAPVIAFAIVFIVVLLALTLVAHLVSKGVHSVGLGPVDRSLGVVFGLLRGVFILGLAGIVMNFVLSDKQRDEFFGDSKTYPMVSYTAELMQALMPSRETVEKVANKNKQAIAKTGRQPLEPGQDGVKASGSSSGGYSKLERKAVDALVQPQIERVKRNFND